MFQAYDTDTLEKVWQSLLKRYDQVLRMPGGKYFEVEHIRTKNRQ